MDRRAFPEPLCRGVQYGRRGTDRHGRQDPPRRGRAIPGHRLSLRRDHRYPRRRRVRLRRQHHQRDTGAHRRRTGSDARCGSVRPRPRTVLWATQGHPTGLSTAELLGVGHRYPAGGVGDSSRFSAHHLRRGLQTGQSQPTCHLDRRGHAVLHRGQRRVGQSPCRGGLSIDLLCAVHPKPVDGSDPRSGRWQGLSKTECGLHVS